MMTAAARDHDIVGGWKQDKDMKYSRYFYQNPIDLEERISLLYVHFLVQIHILSVLWHSIDLVDIL